MPGHSQAAIAAYPWLGNTGKPVGVRTRWGVSKHVYNVDDRTFAFLEDVLTEVMALFPGEFIHIGGDECPKAEWKASPAAQKRIKDEGLEDEHELQSWFIRRIEKFLNARGRRLIGWDEILEGGLAPNATVMSWRGVKGGIAAARAGHDVVMSPNSHCYFDHYQSRDRASEPPAIGGYCPLEKVYAYEPIPEALTPEQAKHVLGAQANHWTEYIPHGWQVEYMAWPRACALAEVVWSPKQARDWPDFRARLVKHLKRFPVMRVRYRPLDPEKSAAPK
jgi:hexosaminidase